jgi:hypothetical protein
MGSTNGGSGDTVPLRIVPDLSERPEYVFQSSSAKVGDVFSEDECGPEFSDDSVELPPEAAFSPR